jgi:hypothetical protein
MKKPVATATLVLGLAGMAAAVTPSAMAAPAGGTHSVHLYGWVSCPAPYYTASRVRIQAFNGEAHDANLYVAGRWYSVTFTQVPSGGEGAYVYISCGMSINGRPLGGIHGLSGPIHINGWFGQEPLNLTAR